MSDELTMFRPRAETGLGRKWHVLERKLYGFMLVAPFPCTFVQAEVISEQAPLARDRLLQGSLAPLERRVCRHCLEAVRSPVTTSVTVSSPARSTVST